MGVPLRDNPVALWALRRRVDFLGRRRLVRRVATAAGAVYASAYVLVSGRLRAAQWRYGSLLDFAQSSLILGLALLVAVLYRAWATSVRESRMLEDLYLAGADPDDTARGLLIHLVLPYLFAGVGVTLAAVFWMLAAFLPIANAPPILWPAFVMLLIGFGFCLASFAGVILRNAWDYYVRYTRYAWEFAEGRWRWVALPALVILMPVLFVAAILFMSGHTFLLTFALGACLVFGDGVKGFMTGFEEEPLFEDEEDF